MWTLDQETRRRYVHGMVRLGTWYVHRLLQQEEVRPHQLVHALSTRVDLFRLTDFWDGSAGAADSITNTAWLEAAAKIAAWIQETPSTETATLEERVLRFLHDSLEARLPNDVGPPPQRPFGCWTYEPGWAGLADRPGLLGKVFNPAHVSAVLRRRVGLAPLPSRHGVLHIMNVMVPHSPFHDMPKLAHSLQALLAKVRCTHPQIRELWCNTWLNEHPRFHELFPDIWFHNGTVSPPGNHRNWWGQFARRDGDFNALAADRFRRSGGVFAFRALLCHAPLDEIDTHLRNRFGSAA